MNSTPNPAASPSNRSPLPTSKQPRTSGLAVASLILGLLGIFILPALGGLVCGLVALTQIRRSGGALRGAGLATAGLVLSAIFLVIGMIAVPVGLLLPALANAKSKAQIIMSLNNVKQLGLAVALYADDSEERFPTPAQWCDRLKPYTGGNSGVFLRPADQQSPVRSSYGYNARLSAAKAGKVNKDTVVIFELQTGGWNVAGGPELLRQPGRFGDPVIVGFADGRAESITAGRVGSLRWDP